MSRNQNYRLQSASPLPNPDTFMTFLDPSPRPNPSPLNTISTRTESPLNKSYKSIRTSPSPHLVASKLELSEKQNLNLQERNKVLIKEKNKLKKQLSKEKTSPDKRFKSHAAILTKRSYIEKLMSKEEVTSDLQKRISGSIKLMIWVNEQAGDTRLAFVKPALDEVFNNLNGLDVEIQGKILAEQESFTSKIKKLEETISSLESRQERETNEVVTILVKKNNELLINNCQLFQKNEELADTVNILKQEVEILVKPEIQSEYREKVINELKDQIFINKKKEDLEVTNSLIELEERFLQLKSYSDGLIKEINAKNSIIEGLYKEIAENNVKSIKGRIKEESKSQLRSWPNENTKRAKPPKYPEQNLDMVSFTCCLAAALEDFLV